MQVLVMEFSFQKPKESIGLRRRKYRKNTFRGNVLSFLDTTNHFWPKMDVLFLDLFSVVVCFSISIFVGSVEEFFFYIMMIFSSNAFKSFFILGEFWNVKPEQSCPQSFVIRFLPSSFSFPFFSSFFVLTPSIKSIGLCKWLVGISF